MKLIVVYDPIYGETVPDEKISSYVKDRIVIAEKYSPTLEIIVGSSLIIEEIRALIAEKTISNKDVTFIFKGEEIHSGTDGSLEYWPIGFCDIYSNILRRVARYKPKQHKLNHRNKK